MPPSRMLRRVGSIRTDVPEERSPSITRETRINELVTTLAVTNQHQIVACCPEGSGFNYARLPSRTYHNMTKLIVNLSVRIYESKFMTLFWKVVLLRLRFGCGNICYCNYITVIDII
jgi:hypothetical protein